jgi:hypothetical protein
MLDAKHNNPPTYLKNKMTMLLKITVSVKRLDDVKAAKDLNIIWKG